MLKPSLSETGISEKIESFLQAGHCSRAWQRCVAHQPAARCAVTLILLPLVRNATDFYAASD
ncbi:hypothetical protein [Synechococcus sp. M16CYN]|uniref:hypothetical protein n=1 Tax=Synechococcus sp. M16CYN TaxID=3103139 RepID=UPI00333F8504